MIIASVDDYRRQCKARLPRFLYDYISGGSYQENTLRANIADLQATLLRQRVLVDESHVNLSIGKLQRIRPFLLLAQSGHRDDAESCPLSGVKRTWKGRTSTLLMTQSGHSKN
jgi:hypothetical protein